MFFYKYHKNSFENNRTDVKIGIFPVPIAYWSGFGIFKQNRKNPDEIGMVGQSGSSLNKMPYRNNVLISCQVTNNNHCYNLPTTRGNHKF